MCVYLAVNKGKTVFYGQKYPGFSKNVGYAEANLILQGLLQLGPNIPQEPLTLSALIPRSLSSTLNYEFLIENSRYLAC